MQQQMFEDTAAEHEADLQAHLDALKAASAQTQPAEPPKRQPRRQHHPICPQQSLALLPSKASRLSKPERTAATSVPSQHSPQDS